MNLQKENCQMNHFKLNMQILYDHLAKEYGHVVLCSPSDVSCLEDVRIYQPGETLHEKYVYLMIPEVNEPFPSLPAGFSFVITGPPCNGWLPDSGSFLLIEDTVSPAFVLTRIQEIFETYRRWDQRLHLALGSENPLDDMMAASLEIFQNPVFVHDPNFYILSCPRTSPGMSVWETDPRTGMKMAPLDLIQDFRSDLEYLHTLGTRRPALYSKELRGYPILYVNLWTGDHYDGRICVDELETPILPGHFSALEYLGQIIICALQSRRLFQLGMGNDISQFFCDYLDGRIQDQFRIIKFLFFLNWNREDHYLCLRLETEQPNLKFRSSAATLGYIETQIPESHAFIHEGGITVVVNLTLSKSQISDVLRSLVFLLREDLLKMGASSELHDFMQLPQGHLQAREALALGQTSQSMNWYFRFDDYMLEYLLKKGEETLAPELLCSTKLLTLKQYDEKNHTEFFQTLKIFLELERNVLQTAKALFIHRSTLFYRLERIQKIADVNLDDARERLLLRISYYILDENHTAGKI